MNTSINQQPTTINDSEQPTTINAKSTRFENQTPGEQYPIQSQISFIKRTRQAACTNANGGTIVFRNDATMLEAIETTLIAVRNILLAEQAKATQPRSHEND